MFYDNYVKLCNVVDRAPSAVAEELGLSRASVNGWKRGKAPTDATLQKIADYFKVDVYKLIQDGMTICPDCEAFYCENLSREVNEHNIRHEKWAAAKRKFNIWNSKERERRFEAKQIEDDVSLPPSKRIEAAEARIFAYFSRSVEGSEFNLNHIPYDEYVSYFLGSPACDISPDIYNLLAGKYKPKPGMRGTYWNCEQQQKSSGNMPKLDNIIPYTQGRKIPIIGSIPAGVPVLAEENIEGYDYADVPETGEYFFLRVKGDSMINANIFDGSLVLVKSQPCAENGQIVVCLINGDEATLKRYYQQKDMVILKPENPDYQPIIVSCNEFENGYARILGIAVEVKIKL